MKLTQFIVAIVYCIFFVITGFSQNHTTCDGRRYVSEVFPNAFSTQNIVYGNNTSYAGSNQDLMMDIYEPTDDIALMRPCIVMAFGGSFITGERDDLAEYCSYYAKRGYVVTTIDYRLYDGPLIPLPDAVMKGFSDMKAAVRFLKEDAATSNTYRIDPNMIFVGGISSGAIVAAHVAYMDSTDNIEAFELNAINNNGGWQGNSSNNASYNAEVQGCINLSGGLRKTHFIDTNDPPLFSVHDDQDPIIPYGGGYVSIFSNEMIYLEGSELMHPQSSEMSISNFLITIPNSSSHVSYIDEGSTYEDSLRTTASQFFHDNVICPVLTDISISSLDVIAADIFPNPAADELYIQFDNLSSDYYSIEVFDNMGNLIYQEQPLNRARYVLQKHNFSSGVYYVNIQFESGKYVPIRSKIIFR